MLLKNKVQKSEIEDSSRIMCPKCGHEFYCDPGWIKASKTIGCPKCSAVIEVQRQKRF